MSYDEWRCTEPDNGQRRSGPSEMLPQTPTCTCGRFVYKTAGGYWSAFCVVCEAVHKRKSA